MRRAKYGTLAVALSAILLAVGCSKQEAASEGEANELRSVNWKMASSFAASLPIIGDSGPYFTAKVKRLSRDRIDIKFFDPGKLVPALEIFDAVSNGAVDAGWSTPGYWIGKVPAAPFFSAVPFGPDAAEYLTWIYYGGGLEIWQELYARHNVHVLPCSVLPPEASGWFREPITDAEQFKGMKIRFFGLGGQAMQKLGASVQLLAGGDIYPALERGVLDATEFSMPVMDERLGFAKIAKHYYFPGWHQQATIGEFMVNMERWNELDAADQEFLDTICRDTIVRNLTLGEYMQTASLERIKKEGVTLHYWPDSILETFKAAWEEVIVEQTAGNVDFKRAYDSYKTFREQYSEWAQLSRTPASMK